MEIIDISRGLSDSLAPWPGDTAFHFQLNWKMAEGATVNVGKFGMGVHNGTHVDAPFHFDPDGETIEQLALEAFVGPAVVMDLTETLAKGMREISVTDLESIAAELRDAPRLLLKTGAWRDSRIFPKEIPVISAAVPPWLQARGVKLLGLDLPSVDPIDSKELSNHHLLAAAGITIVESLDLSEVQGGHYHFAALPLKIEDADAAPARAILWRS
jgi:arylformamidase